MDTNPNDLLGDKLPRTRQDPHPGPPPSDGRGRTFASLVVNLAVSSISAESALKPALLGLQRKHLRHIWTALVALLAAGVAGWLMLPLVPLPAALLKERRPSDVLSLEFVDKDGRPLRQTTDGQSYWSKPAGFSEIPESLIAATLAAEDKRFWKHSGIDWRATTRAALSLVRH